MTKERKPRKKSEKQLLIESLLGLSANPRPINWGMEMKLLNKVLKQFPETGFWFEQAKKTTYSSMTMVLMWANNTGEIHAAYNAYTKANKLELKTPAPQILQNEKVGEDIIVPQKPKTLLDFIS